MNKIRYILEIFQPASATEVLVSYTSATPFMPMECGALIDLQFLSDTPLRIVNVVHGLSQAELITHKVTVFTEELAIDAEGLQNEPDAVVNKKQRFRSACAGITELAKGLSIEPGFAKLSGRGKAILEGQMPRLRELWNEKIGPVAKEALENDAGMAEAFRRVYQLLPTPVRWWVKEESFVAFCLTNKDKIIDKNSACATSQETS